MPIPFWVADNLRRSGATAATRYENSSRVAPFEGRLPLSRSCQCSILSSEACNGPRLVGVLVPRNWHPV
jgi:hypothetical protein